MQSKYNIISIERSAYDSVRATHWLKTPRGSGMFTKCLFKNLPCAKSRDEFQVLMPNVIDLAKIEEFRRGEGLAGRSPQIESFLDEAPYSINLCQPINIPNDNEINIPVIIIAMHQIKVETPTTRIIKNKK